MVKILKKIREMMHIEVEVDERVVRYIKENPHSIFILAFIVLLISAAVNLAIGRDEFAERLAVFAYYALVIGVILAIVLFIIKKGELPTA